MLGWELPPQNSGGLGVACYGLSKSLVKQGTGVAFGMPYPLNSDIDFMPVMSTTDGMEVTGIQADFTAYMDAQTYRKMKSRTTRAAKDMYEAAVQYGNRAASWADTVAHEVVHAHDWMTYPAGMLSAKRSGHPLVAHVHATEYDRTGGMVDGRIAEIEYEGLNKADKVIAVSEYTKRVVQTRYGVKPTKIAVVHNGIDPAAFDPILVRTVFPRDKVVAYVGRLTFQKGVDYFLRMAKEVLVSHPDTVFVVAGAGDMYQHHILQAASLGISNRVIFTGFLQGDKLRSLYGMADAFVMPSVSEPYGLVALEAVAAGVPVVLSKQSGVSETIHRALQVDFWDIQRMAYLVGRVLTEESKAAQMALLAKAEAREMTWDRAAQKTLSVYNELV